MALRDRGVISSELYAAIRGLGHVRNLLAHDYVEVDVDLLARHLDESFRFFPAFCRELAAWLGQRNRIGS